MTLPAQTFAAAVTSCALLAIGLPSTARIVDAGAWCVPLGLAAGVALCAALARAWPRLPPPGVRQAVAVTATYLAARSTFEEILWRGLVLAVLLRALHPIPALAVNVAAWTLSHRRVQGLRPAHVATGTVFATLFYATGSLASSIAAHVSYNVAICFGIAGARPPT